MTVGGRSAKEDEFASGGARLIRLLAEDDVDSGEEQCELLTRQLADARGEEGLIDSDDLRDVGDGILGQSGKAR